jgi:hypothetical protein
MHCLCKLALNWRTIRIENLRLFLKKGYTIYAYIANTMDSLMDDNVKLFYTFSAYPLNPYVSSSSLIH